MKWFFVLVISIELCSCKTSKPQYNPYKKFSALQLQEDFEVYRNILEERHPGLYWYTPKSTMDKVFEAAKLKLKDSTTVYQFRNLLNQVSTRIQCGHTTVQLPKQYARYINATKNTPIFPLYLKIWNDTAVVTYNIYRDDSTLTRGTIINRLNGIAIKDLIDTMYTYIAADGNNALAKDQLLSTGNYFGVLYNAIYGKKREYRITYINKVGDNATTIIKPYSPPKDSTSKHPPLLQKGESLTKKEKLQEERSLTIDSTGIYAVMELNSFSEKLQLSRFFKQSFKKLQKLGVKNLIIDLRSNGGGRVNNATAFTKYLIQKKFKLADSLYAVTRHSAYSRYIKNDLNTKFMLRFFSQKKADGYYHFTWYEKHYFKPKRKYHYDGTVYILSGGNSFSATTLAMSALKGQQHIVLLGEATGGAAYGNSAFLTPAITLPHTKIRCRLPLFRLVMNKNIPKDGQGIQPEIYIGPTVEAIREGRDYKMEKALILIKAKNKLPKL